MSVTPKEQFEDAIAENARLRRELDAAQAESAEARGNVEKALRELAEEVHKRQKAERQCAEMLNAISRDLPLLAKSLEHFNGYADWRNRLLQIHEAPNKTDCGKDYVPKAEVDKLHSQYYEWIKRAEDAEGALEIYRSCFVPTAQLDKVKAVTRQLVEALDLTLRHLKACGLSDGHSTAVTATKALAAAKEVL